MTTFWDILGVPTGDLRKPYLECMQAPVTMDRVVLERDGGDPVVLARIRDVEGCWLCSPEVYRKLGSSVAKEMWRYYINVVSTRPEGLSCIFDWHWF